MILSQIDSGFLRYLLSREREPGARLPALEEISAEIGIGLSKLREQLEVARILGLVEIGPRRGIRWRGYDFLPTLRLSLMVALSLDSRAFVAFSSLRTHLEAAFWDEAVVLLTVDDREALQALVARAQDKLSRERIQIPHSEHRALHLRIFSRLDNPFVGGILECYWDAYEAVELHTYADYAYLQEVWRYHGAIVDAICGGEFAAGKELLRQHMRLIDRLGLVRDGLIPSPAGSRAGLGSPASLSSSTTAEQMEGSRLSVQPAPFPVA